MAEVERPVMVVTTVAMATIKHVRAAEENTLQSLQVSWMKRMCNTVSSFLAALPIALRVLLKVTARPQSRAAAGESATCATVVTFHIKVENYEEVPGGQGRWRLVCEMRNEPTHSVEYKSTTMSTNTGWVPFCSVTFLNSHIWICQWHAASSLSGGISPQRSFMCPGLEISIPEIPASTQTHTRLVEAAESFENLPKINFALGELLVVSL